MSTKKQITKRKLKSKSCWEVDLWVRVLVSIFLVLSCVVLLWQCQKTDSWLNGYMNDIEYSWQDAKKERNRGNYPGVEYPSVCYTAWISGGATVAGVKDCEKTLNDQIVPGTRMKNSKIHKDCDVYVLDASFWSGTHLHYHYKAVCGQTTLHSAECDKDIKACPSAASFYFYHSGERK